MRIQIRRDVNSPIRHSFQESLARLWQGRRSYIHTIKERLSVARAARRETLAVSPNTTLRRILVIDPSGWYKGSSLR